MAYLIGLILCRKLLKVHIRPRIRILLATVHRVTMLLNIDLICERFWVPMGPRCKLDVLTFICVGLRIVSSCVGLRIVSFWLNMTVDRRGQNCQAPVSVSEPASASGSTLQSIKASEPSSSGSAVAAKYHQQECQKTHSMYSHSLLCTVVYGQILAKGREGKRTYRVVRLICLVVITKTQSLMLLR